MIFSADSSSVFAVLDWELSTLGDPLSDVANSCIAYHRPHDNPLFVGKRMKIKIIVTILISNNSNNSKDNRI